MAYRRKSRSHRLTHRRKSRRMGAVRRSGGTSRLLGLVVGAAATGFINKMIGAKLDPKITAGIEVAAGYFLPTFVKGELMAGVGDGLIAAGGLQLLNSFGVLQGIPLIAGFRDLQAVNGTPAKAADSSKVVETARNTRYNPTMSQVVNGVYNRYNPDPR